MEIIIKSIKVNFRYDRKSFVYILGVGAGISGINAIEQFDNVRIPCIEEILFKSSSTNNDEELSAFKTEKIEEEVNGYLSQCIMVFVAGRLDDIKSDLIIQILNHAKNKEIITVATVLTYANHSEKSDINSIYQNLGLDMLFINNKSNKEHLNNPELSILNPVYNIIEASFSTIDYYFNFDFGDFMHIFRKSDISIYGMGLCNKEEGYLIALEKAINSMSVYRRIISLTGPVCVHVSAAEIPGWDELEKIQIFLKNNFNTSDDIGFGISADEKLGNLLKIDLMLFGSIP